MDLIDRQELLTELDRYIDAHRGYGFENVRVILRGLKREIIDFPCAQPEKRTDKRTGTHACDSISRQAAIDALSTPHGILYPIRTVEELPSAQPEVCEGCKHLGKWENEVEYGYPSPCTRCKRRAGDHYER